MLLTFEMLRICHQHKPSPTSVTDINAGFIMYLSFGHVSKVSPEQSNDRWRMWNNVDIIWFAWWYIERRSLSLQFQSTVRWSILSRVWDSKSQFKVSSRISLSEKTNGFYVWPSAQVSLFCWPQYRWRHGCTCSARLWNENELSHQPITLPPNQAASLLYNGKFIMCIQDLYLRDCLGSV